MALILNIETATTVCSVALANGATLLAHRELDNGFTHAENLHRFIQEILQEARVEVKQLAAVAVSKGPGSYTGLRIGASTAKGLAYALGIPLIAVDTLQVMSQRALNANAAYPFYCPMIDARRMEVYTAVHDKTLQVRLPTEALIVDELSIEKLKAYPSICFFGDGMPKCRELLAQLPGAGFINSIMPTALDMYPLAQARFTKQQFENLAYFEPFYLKDFLITSKKKQA